MWISVVGQTGIQQRSTGHHWSAWSIKASEGKVHIKKRKTSGHCLFWGWVGRFRNPNFWGGMGGGGFQKIFFISFNPLQTLPTLYKPFWNPYLEMLDFLQDNKYFPPNGWKGVNEPLLHCQRKLFNFQGVGGWVRQNKKCSLHFFYTLPLKGQWTLHLQL